MYYYVEDKQFLRRAQRDSSSMLTELVEELRRNGMNSQFFLVGSGGRILQSMFIIQQFLVKPDVFGFDIFFYNLGDGFCHSIVYLCYHFLNFAICFRGTRADCTETGQ